MNQQDYNKIIKQQQEANRKAFEKKKAKDLEKLKAGTFYPKVKKNYWKGFNLKINIKMPKKKPKGKMIKIKKIACELCQTKSSLAFDDHHIVFRSEAPYNKELNNPRNIIYVCRNCHNFLHANKRKNRRQLIRQRKLDKLFSTGSKVKIEL